MRDRFGGIFPEYVMPMARVVVLRAFWLKLLVGFCYPGCFPLKHGTPLRCEILCENCKDK